MVHIAALQLHTFETSMQRSISKIRNEYPKYVFEIVTLYKVKLIRKISIASFVTTSWSMLIIFTA